MSLFKFGLGDEVKDSITGIKGVVTARTEWLNHCIRYVLQPVKLKEDGSRHDEVVIDEDQLVLVKSERVSPPALGKARTGGPKSGEHLLLRRRK